MKKVIQLIILAIMCMPQMGYAQEYEYVPFVREGVKWVYYYHNAGNQYYPPEPGLQTGKVYLTLELKGETVINDKTYMAMHKYYGDAINEENDTIPIYLREENQVVYGIVPDGKTYADCPIGNICEGDNLFFDLNNGNEFVLYDFQDPVAYWGSHYNDLWDDSIYKFISIDTIAIGNHLAKKYINSLRDGLLFYIIEGVGFDAPTNGYTLFPFRPMGTGTNDAGFKFSHVIEDGQIVYKGFNFNPDDWNGIDEVVAEKPRARQVDDNYYNLMGQPVGKTLPTVPGIYIHHGKKIVVR